MSSWPDLDHELQHWRDAGRIATFWWRDDDATAPSAALDRLLALARRNLLAPMLAVIPAEATAGLAARLAGEPAVVAQHGFRHANHAPPAVKKSEFGPDRAMSYMLGELCRGAVLLDRLFGPAWLRVLVPPYNAIAGGLIPALRSLGYCGLSTDRPRRCAVVTGFVETNTHIDPIAWPTTQRFAGESAALGAAIGHLAARRSGAVDASEPTGLLTHHLVHDEAIWSFIAALFERTRDERAVRWLTPVEAFTADRS